jgi:hypothetical protein
MRNATLALGFVLALLTCGCGGDESGSGGGTGPASAPAAPTKEAVIGLLRGLMAALEAKDHDKALEFLVAFPGMDPARAREAVGGFVGKREISAAGIDVLEARGTFGPLKEVFPDRAEYLAKKAGVDPEKCVALSLDPAEVAVYWGGDKPRFIRLDDVGKLE